MSWLANSFWAIIDFEYLEAALCSDVPADGYCVVNCI